MSSITITPTSPIPIVASCNPIAGLAAAYIEGYRIACAHDYVIAKVGHVAYQAIKDSIFLSLGIVIGLLQYFSMLLASPIVWGYKRLDFLGFLYLQRAIFLEACCGMASYATRFTKPQYVAAADSTKPVILLIHGLMHNGAAWNYQRQQLMKQGYDVVCPSWGGPGQTLEEAAQKVADIWQTECANNEQLKGRPVLLVGHSTGYAISQTLLRKGRFSEQAVAYVSVCGPTEGTRLACGLPLTPLIREMRAGVWDKNLVPPDHKTFKPKACRIIEVEHDVMIWSSGLERDENSDIDRKLYNAGGHSSLLFADVTTEAILEAAEELARQS